MRAGFFFLLSLATLAGNWGGLRDFAEGAAQNATEWRGRTFHGNGEHTDAPRELAERFVPPGETVYYCPNSKDGSFQPAERSIHLALSWARSPDPVRFGDKDGAGDASAIIVSRFLRVDFPGYWQAAENDSAVLWRRGDMAANAVGRARGMPPPAPWREALGVVFVCALVSVFVWRMRLGRMESNGGGSFPRFRMPPPTANTILTVCVAAFFMFTAAATLTHTFMAPTGLGVYGGKAKLLYLNSGIPPGFFTDPAFSSYQPAYPPGLALLTLCSYWISGGCGEWLTQLISVFAMAAALLWLGGRAVSPWALFWVWAAFLNKQTLQMATLYYAEPFVALFVLAGWERLRSGRNDIPGWMLVGAAGFFKNEGLVFLLVLWLVLRLRPGRIAALWRGLLAGAALPVLWHVSCRLAGAQLYDYAPIWRVDFGQGALALGQAFKLAFAEPWRYGFVYPLAGCAAVLALVAGRRRPGLRLSPSLGVALAFSGLCWLAFAAIYALSAAPDFGWHLRSSLPRLLWIPAILLLRELAAGARNGPRVSQSFS